MSVLNRPVLVLNKVWMPIRVVPTYRALVLMFANKASAVDPNTYYAYKWDDWVKEPVEDTDNIITTSRDVVKAPEVIVLSTYDKVYRKDIRLTKRNIYIRDGYKCQYSGKKIKESDADIDHVIPRSKGGRNSWENMVVCSKDINRMKADRTPEQAGLKLIKRPTKPSSGRLLIDPKVKVPESWSKFIKGNK